MAAKKNITRIFSILIIILFMLSVTPFQEVRATGPLFAKPVASGSGDCSSWLNACTLQSALGISVSGDVIWAEAGTYKPTSDPADRNATFQLIDGVALYGGFAGTESLLSQRDPAGPASILSGDIDGNDTQTPIITDLATVAGNTTNSYHVVKGVTGAILDPHHRFCFQIEGRQEPLVTAAHVGEGRGGHLAGHARPALLQRHHDVLLRLTGCLGQHA